MNDPAQHDAGYFALVFRPNRDLVSLVRRFVSDFYAEVLTQEDDIQRLALATHELLENAVKFSARTETAVQIQLKTIGNRTRVLVETRNEGKEENVREAMALMDDLSAASDPFIYYQDLLRRAAVSERVGGLGLARVWVEAEMKLSHVFENDIFIVRAESEVHEGALK